MSEALLAAVLADPDNPAPRLVYADWLAQQGDPRGELIALQAQGAHELAARLIERHKAHFYGALEDTIGGPVAVNWHLGFICSAAIVLGRHEEWERYGVADFLDALLELPSARLIEGLELGHRKFGTLADLDAIVTVLARHRPVALRTLELGDFSVDAQQPGRVVSLRPLWPALPRLAQLRLMCGHVDLAGIHAPELRSLDAYLDGSGPGHLEAIATADWPRLESLELQFAHAPHSRTLNQLLASEHLPRLTELRLSGIGSRVGAIRSSRLLAQLVRLDLSGSGITLSGARAIAQARRAFEHLLVLDLRDNPIGRAGRDVLAVIPGVRTDHDPLDPTDGSA